MMSCILSFCRPPRLARSISLAVLLGFTILFFVGMSLRAQTSTNLPTPVVFSGVLQADDGNYYSTMANGGSYCNANYNYICGAVYKMTPQGVATKEFDFGPAQGSNGSYPNALIEGPDGSFYGTTPSGGTDPCACGVFFKLDRTGAFTLLHSFSTADFQQTSAYYSGGSLGHLVLGSDGNFYGYNFAGYAGTIFRLTPAGDFTLLASFFGNTGTGGGFIPSGLIETTDGNFYVTVQGYSGTTGVYPSSGGFLYKMTASGTLTMAASFPGDGSLGFDPNGDLAQGPDGSIYGVTRGGGGTNASPTIYKYTPGGSIQTLYTFPSSGANGSYLVSGLILASDGNLYGTSQYGSTTPCYKGCGTAFQITPTGAFSVIHMFAGGTDGGSPYGPIIQSNDGTITGTNGGTTAATAGTIYSISEGAVPPIGLSFQFNGQDVTTVGSNEPITLNWKVLNAFSTTAQQCYAYQLNRPTGNTDWTGKQAGTLVNDQWTGAATFNAPTAVGTYTYALTCAGLETGLATLSVAGVTITTTTLPDATVSKPYNTVIQGLGGVTPYAWGYSGAFPAGLTIDSASGYITGTPTQFGTFSVTIGATDSSSTPQIGTRTFSLKIASGLSLAGSLNNGIAGSAYTATATVSGGLGPYKWALVSGRLPDGINLNTSTGVLSGKPTMEDKYTFAIMVTDGEGTPATFTESYTVSTITPPLQIVSGDFSDCMVNVLCDGQYEATGGTPPYTWTIAVGTTFPAGLTLSTSGVFSGLPKQYSIGSFGTPGPDTLTVQVSDSSTPSLMVVDHSNLNILSTLKLVSIPLPVVTVGIPYRAPPPVATGGIPPYHWTINSISAPQLITEYGRDETTGVIYSDKPATIGTFILKYQLSDSEGIPATVSMDATLMVVLPQTPSVTMLSSSASSAGTGTKVTLAAMVTTTGGPATTGSVTFYNGGASLGTVTVDSTGTASLDTSFSAPGVYTLTASYSGAGSITASVSSPLTETVVTPAVSASFSPGTLTVAAGSSGTMALTLTPTGGYIGTVTFSCGALPAHVSCTFAPPSLTIASGASSLTDTLTIHTSSITTAAVEKPHGGDSSQLILAALLLVPFSGLALFDRRPKASLLRLTALCLLVLGLGAVSGCGSSSPSRTQAAPGSYSIPITLQLSGGATESVSASLIVQ